MQVCKVNRALLKHQQYSVILFSGQHNKPIKIQCTWKLQYSNARVSQQQVYKYSMKFKDLVHNVADVIQPGQANISTFRGPCIVIYSYNKPTTCTNFSNLFLEQNSVCFGQVFCPSSGVQHCIHSNRQVIQVMLTACQRAVSITCPKHVEFYSKNKFEKLVHLIGFIIRTSQHYNTAGNCRGSARQWGNSLHWTSSHSLSHCITMLKST